ncbi:type I restriction enzyme endonuclease domain-containing protein [uncultured Dialister sp.]|uniref:type I restriction enzyme endonuclease domain-containing protein n=1 Tax=uncultured Dialister sp. TaxID=278064 RepID=UPI0025D176DA|nr:type I restriction enzyme endonuclease domain-containing protein [uncultured Dialister sp.]
MRQEYEELQRLAEAMTKEEKRFSREGFENEDELAVYDILVYKKGLTPGDIKKIKQCAKDITAVIRKKLLEMDHWKEKEQTREDMKYAIRNTLAPDVPESYDWDDVQHLTQRLYEHAYRHY